MCRVGCEINLAFADYLTSLFHWAGGLFCFPEVTILQDGTVKQYLKEFPLTDCVRSSNESNEAFVMPS